MKKNLNLLLALFSAFSMNAQHLDMTWSNQMLCDNKQDGFFDEFIGSNAQYVYARFSTSRLYPAGDNGNVSKNEKFKVLAFDKSDMRMAKSVNLKGYPGNKDLDDAEFHSAFVFEDKIHLYYIEKKKNVIEVYGQVLDKDLRVQKAAKKIYELSNPQSKLSDGGLILLANKSGKVLVGCEIISKENKDLKLDYRIMNQDMVMENSKQVTLPITVVSVRRKYNNSAMFRNFRYNYAQKRMALCSYLLSESGDVYVFADLESKNKKENYVMISRINTSNGSLSTYDLVFPGKNIVSYRVTDKNMEIGLLGFYSNEGDKSNNVNGIFMNKLDKDLESTKLKFIPFDKKMVNSLFANDEEERKIMQKKASKKDGGEAELYGDYNVEYLMDEGSKYVLFCSKTYNYYVTECRTSSTGSGGSTTTCYDVPYCEKSNVTVFKVTENGDLEWAKNLDRKSTYRYAWNVRDLNVIKGDNYYHVVYGSDYQMNAQKKNRKSRKDKRQTIDRLEYASFSASNGNFNKYEYKINAINAKKENIKKISPTNLWVFDNKMYTESSRYKLKGSTWIACLCPPVFFVMTNKGNAYRGYSYFGTISALD
ncbi:MAG TPA: hypothetical protein PLQ93_05490 [Bacteroidia bacterium]|nr:hypothetical protein [Bacteroidia bacterium]